MESDEELKEELEEEFASNELLKIARDRGITHDLKSKEQIIEWLLDNGLTRREYELHYSPHISQKLRVCKFFGIKKGWRVMDVGCGSGGTSIAAASLVGSEGYVLAVDCWEEYMSRCLRHIRKVGFEEIIETKLANVTDLEFEENSFDMVVLLYSPQFIGYLGDFEEALSTVKGWTNRIGIADHIPVPGTLQESIYLLYNWLSNDAARKSIGKRTDRLFHPEEIKGALKSTGWTPVRDKVFRVDKKNAFPEWAMNENAERIKKQIEMVSDPLEREILSSRLQTIVTLTEQRRLPRPTSMYAVVAQN